MARKIVLPEERAEIPVDLASFDLFKPIGLLHPKSTTKQWVIRSYKDEFTVVEEFEVTTYKKENIHKWYGTLEDLLVSYLQLGTQIYQFDSYAEFFTWLSQ
jgi:hypothetical protein